MAGAGQGGGARLWFRRGAGSHPGAKFSLAFLGLTRLHPVWWAGLFVLGFDLNL